MLETSALYSALTKSETVTIRRDFAGESETGTSTAFFFLSAAVDCGLFSSTAKKSSDANSRPVFRAHGPWLETKILLLREQRAGLASRHLWLHAV